MNIWIAGYLLGYAIALCMESMNNYRHFLLDERSGYSLQSSISRLEERVQTSLLISLSSWIYVSLGVVVALRWLLAKGISKLIVYLAEGK